MFRNWSLLIAVISFVLTGNDVVARPNPPAPWRTGLGAAWPNPPDGKWGFFGHKRINRLAVFTLPPEMMVFYKKNIEYVTEHAVDPDKRRYATKHEGSRHYIDLDRYGKMPFDNLPRDWNTALMYYTDWIWKNTSGDTVRICKAEFIRNSKDSVCLEGKWNGKKVRRVISVAKYKPFFLRNFVYKYYDDEIVSPVDSFNALFGVSLPEGVIEPEDYLTEHGVNPYNLTSMFAKLVTAFKERDHKQILKLSTEFGHYVGDAHVPLHTCSNYNGQLTGQDGIHGFWESRIPELFADLEYDALVGSAVYIKKPNEYFWKIVFDSHAFVDSVLTIEKRLSQTYPTDQQYCQAERLGLVVRAQCPEYAKEYEVQMDGMIENRWRASIHTIGSLWYTAWVDAGQPDMSKPGVIEWTEAEKKAMEAEEKIYRAGKIKGRPHDD